MTTVVSTIVNANSDVSVDIEDFFGDNAKTDDVQIFSLLNKKPSCKVLDPNKDYVIWLDSCANVGVFRNRNLLDDIRPGPANSVSGFRSKVSIYHIGTNAIFLASITVKHDLIKLSYLIGYWHSVFTVVKTATQPPLLSRYPEKLNAELLVNATGYLGATLVISMAFLR